MTSPETARQQLMTALYCGIYTPNPKLYAKFDKIEKAIKELQELTENMK